MKESQQANQPQKQPASSPKQAESSQAADIGMVVAFQLIQKLPAHPTNRNLRQNSVQQLQPIGNRTILNLVMASPENEAEPATDAENEQVIYQDNTRLYSGPHDDILDAEPLAVLARGARIRILDTSEPTFTQVEVLDGPAAGSIGFVSGLAPPHISAGEYQSLEEMLQYNGPRGWHVSLPESSLEAGSIGVREAHARGETPALSGSYPAEPQLEPTEHGAAQARQRLLDFIREQLAGVRIPTESGQMDVFRGRGGRGGGYAYQAQNYATQSSQQHQEYLGQVSLEGLGLDASNPRIAALWGEFHRIISHEGDTSAINAYDDQIVTIGAGFSAHSGDAGAIYNRMPQETRQRLYEHGIRVNEDNSFSVLDLNRGVVERGNNALRLMQVDPRRLGLLVQEAQSQREMSQGEQRMSSAAWMVRAQFEQFMDRNRAVPDSVFQPPWTAQTRRFAFRLKHWAGSLDWGEMGRMNGNVRRLAGYALGQVRRAQPNWSETFVREKIQTISAGAGCGNPW